MRDDPHCIDGWPSVIIQIKPRIKCSTGRGGQKPKVELRSVLRSISLCTVSVFFRLKLRFKKLIPSEFFEIPATPFSMFIFSVYVTRMSRNMPYWPKPRGHCHNSVITRKCLAKVAERWKRKRNLPFKFLNWPVPERCFQTRRKKDAKPS